MHGKALWYVAPGRAELRDEPVSAPKPGELQVRALYSAISRGTERLVHAGRVPASEYARMRAPMMGGAFPFPVKYGYATVGRVEAGPAELRGRIRGIATEANRGADRALIAALPRLEVISVFGVGTDTIDAVASEAEGEARDRLFSAQVARSPQFAEYQKKTERTIPVIVLEPIS